MKWYLHSLIIFLCAFGLLTACKSSLVSPAINANQADNSACGDCHGSIGNPSPPPDTFGNMATTFTGVGAHESHMKEGLYRVAVQCTDCHVVPTAVSSVGHIDTSLPAEVVFGELAKIQGSSPAWNGTTCTNVYCHGAALLGGTNTSPTWTIVNGSQVSCTSCHAMPPPTAEHSGQNDHDCYLCHGEVVNSSLAIINKSLHINGEVNVTGGQTCTSCHGMAAAGNNAPPLDTLGNTSTSFRGVGAHQSHMATKITANVSCVVCHIVPAQITDPGHNDTALPAELTFGSLAKTGGVTPMWNGTTCANVYCHGNFSGGLKFSPTWTTVNGTQGKCGTCHALPPSTGQHKLSNHRNLSCAACHGSYYSSTSVRVSDHINGMKDVGGPGSEIQTWNAGNLTCDPTCHGSERW